MSTPKDVDIGEIFRQGTRIDEAMNEAVRQAVEAHRREGLPLVVWENGRVVKVDPNTGATEIVGEGADSAPPST